jgi:hypothetical protein
MHGYNKNKNHYYFVPMSHPFCVIRVFKKKEQKILKTMKKRKGKKENHKLTNPLTCQSHIFLY